MESSSDIPMNFKRALAGIDYTSPVCKINVAVNRIPDFLANPNNSPDSIMPHHQATIHLNCEKTEMIEEAYQVWRSTIEKHQYYFMNFQFQDAKKGEYSRAPMIEMVIPSSLDPTLAPPGHHVCLLFTQFVPYHLRNGTWDEAKKEEYANVVFNCIER